MPDPLKTPRRFTTRGWTLVRTGGNCVALRHSAHEDGTHILATAAGDTGLAPHVMAEVTVSYHRSVHGEPLATETVPYRHFMRRPAAEWFARLSHPAAIGEGREQAKSEARTIASLREFAQRDGDITLVALCRLALGARRETLDPHELRAIMQAELLGAPTWTAQAAWTRCLALAGQRGR